MKLFTEGTTAVDEQPDARRSKGVRLIANTTEPLSRTNSLKRPFSLVQVYRPDAGRLVVHLETVAAPQHGREYIRLLFAHARDLAATRFTLTASMIGGSQEGVFAWARYGFVPLLQDWDDMRRSGLAALDGDPEPLRPHNTALRDILLDPSPKALRRLVHHCWKRKGATVDFLNATLTSHVSWKRELDLADDAGCSWLQAYASLPNASEHLDTFTPLLPAPSARLSAPLPVLPVEPPADEDLEKADNPFDLTEDEMVSLLVGQIRAQEITLDEVVEEYGTTRPEIVQKVRAALGL